ncbi:n1-acetylpolyamine oxidase [Colletotrichum incanum]|uniref:N1-acetylpolyamine oxidase n=1 Tax=Colletotrichum incanum TaxID=1573173 RepID=A0A162Q3W0_COLIC|nr:n1-acetylpolyamine oxidase [Colletotrichum incanum]OHW93484.1 n1-acetylpolyamine oxidase [Colletotrichum incanum]
MTPNSDVELDFMTTPVLDLMAFDNLEDELIDWEFLSSFDPVTEVANWAVSTSPQLLFSQELAFRPFPTLAPATTIALPEAALVNFSNSSTFRPECPEDWEAKKGAIRSLYLEENLPLRELTEVMSTKYGFSAT